MTDRWKLTLQDTDDPYGHSARAQQRTTTLWDVEYYRGEELDSSGCVGTPPPHAPPVTILMSTLKGLRVEADYEARVPVAREAVPDARDRAGRPPTEALAVAPSVTLRHAVTDPHVDLRLQVMEHVQHHHERTVSIGRSRGDYQGRNRRLTSTPRTPPRVAPPSRTRSLSIPAVGHMQGRPPHRGLEGLPRSRRVDSWLHPW